MQKVPINIWELFIKLITKIGYFFLSLYDRLYLLTQKFLGSLKKNRTQRNFSLKKKLPKTRISKIRIKPIKFKKIRTGLPPFSKMIKACLRAPLYLFSAVKVALGRLKLFFIGLLAGIFFLLLPYVAHTWFKELPSPEMLVVAQKYGATQILDRNGVLLYEIYADKKYEPVDLEVIPDNLVNATVAVEDSLFYLHSGLRPDSILRAFSRTFFNGDKQGGSTITQQLVKNVLLTPERTFSRKLKEAVLSVMVETKYSKEQILEMYLNNIAYGGNAWGVQSAAQKYFAKNVWELDLAECSMLAGLPSSPSRYSPLSDIKVAKERQRYVLDRMVLLGYVKKAEADEAYAEEIVLAQQKDFILAPHFVNYIRKNLEEMYGENFVDRGGLRVTTTLDYSLQQKSEDIVFDEVLKGDTYGFSNGAAVVLDVNNSEILAYVGSSDYFAPVWGAFDVVTSLRQPGSSIKPVTYSLALATDYTAATIINDSPVVYRSEGSEPYRPVNYDSRYHGNVTLRSALANSYNIPAVKVADKVGPDDIVLLGKDMGLTNWEVDGSYGLAVTLGGKEVRLLDLANVYATLARKGAQAETSAILSIRDGRGYEIYSKKQLYPRQVISEEVSYVMWDILSDNNARLPAFGVRNFLTVPGHKIAVKTGTTNLIKDNWTFGFTPSYVVGVWVGNNDNTPMKKNIASGLTGAAPIWNRIMSEVLAGKTVEEFEMPSGVFFKKDESCGRSEIFIKGSNIPKSLCPVPKDSDEEDKNED